jgi:tRNA-splicing endonuclease subunit Sen2
VTSEEVTAKRRQQRKQFKIDRAKAIAAAAAEAETAFAEGRASTSTIFIPSGATWRPSTDADDSNQRGPQPADIGGGTTAVDDDDDDDDEEEEEEVPNIERLQLTLQEAFFLIWSFDCLSIINPNTVSVHTSRDETCFSLFLSLAHADVYFYQNEPMTLLQIWLAFQSCHLSPIVPSMPFTGSLRPDAPFLVNYVVYHHYRSLGWVVKSGIKFCVDYLLYKRGPVFNHAEYAFCSP